MNTELNNAFQNELGKINKAGDTWFTENYLSSTEKLASIFEMLYVARGTYLNTNAVIDEVYSNCYKQLKEACDAKGCKYRSNAPTVTELLVKLAFYKPNAEKRVSSYLRAFNTLIMLEKVNETNVVKFIIDAGGIEEVRLMQGNGKAKVDKLATATKLVNEMDTLHVMTDSKHAKANTANEGEIVLMVGVQTAHGTVNVKDYVWQQQEANGKNISGKSAIKTALMNIYSVNNALAGTDSDKNQQTIKEDSNTETTNEHPAQPTGVKKFVSANNLEMSLDKTAIAELINRKGFELAA